jgi:RNase P subunit RPR2
MVVLFEAKWVTKMGTRIVNDVSPSEKQVTCKKCHALIGYLQSDILIGEECNYVFCAKCRAVIILKTYKKPLFDDLDY